MREQLISVIIAERPYRLSVGSEAEEELFRKASRLIEEKMSEYAGNYAFRDSQDLLAMVNLQLAVEYLRLSKVAENKALFLRQLQEMDTLLDKSLA